MSESKTGEASDIVSTGKNRTIHNVNFNLDQVEFEEADTLSEENINCVEISNAMRWHLRLSHASRKYLLEFAKRNPDVLKEADINSGKGIEECETCLITKSVKQPFSNTQSRAEKPLQIIHVDIMGPMSHVSHPSGYKLIVVFVDDYSRVALAYPMKQKTEVPTRKSVSRA